MILFAEDEHPYALNTYLLEERNKLGIAYVHFIEPRAIHFMGVASPHADFNFQCIDQNLDVSANPAFRFRKGICDTLYPDQRLPLLQWDIAEHSHLWVVLSVVSCALVFRCAFHGAFIAAGGHSRASGIAAIMANHCDAIAYSRPYLANPDFVKRFELDAPLNKYDRNTFYTQDQ
ncbi:probable 12-oxophytodienoate reductase 1 [Coccomyxa sp. Obi]|nr:probable 12-oxophytodienoate reductase 1 [Coccomyxa sp. Obi]